MTESEKQQAHELQISNKQLERKDKEIKILELKLSIQKEKNKLCN